MSQFACGKCGSTGFVGEMRRVVMVAGPNNELQMAGLVPVRRCANPQCNTLTTPCNLQIGELANLQPIPPEAPPVEAVELKSDAEAEADLAESIAHLSESADSPPPPSDGSPTAS